MRKRGYKRAGSLVTAQQLARVRKLPLVILYKVKAITKYGKSHEYLICINVFIACDWMITWFESLF